MKCTLRTSTLRQITLTPLVKEKCHEYNIPLCVALMHCEKAFDSVVQTLAILTSLQEKGIEDVCIEILFKIHIHGQLSKVHKESETLRIKRGVRQETPSHPICSQQYRRALFRRLNWENKGVHQGGGVTVFQTLLLICCQ